MEKGQDEKEEFESNCFQGVYNTFNVPWILPKGL
jgi:hypothetical protein